MNKINQQAIIENVAYGLLIGFGLVGCTVQDKRSPSTVSQDIAPTPTFSAKDMAEAATIKSVEHGVISIKVSAGYFVPMPDCTLAPPQILDFALQHYPNAKKFTMQWSGSLGSSSGSSRLIYNRRQQTLEYHENTGADFGAQTWKYDYRFDKVTDKTLEQLALRPLPGSQDAGFLSLPNEHKIP